jgi:hypothetical protein
VSGGNNSGQLGTDSTANVHTWTKIAITDDKNTQINKWTRIEGEGLSGHCIKVAACSHPGNSPQQAYALTDDLQLFVTGTIQPTPNENPFGFSFASPVTA